MAGSVGSGGAVEADRRLRLEFARPGFSCIGIDGLQLVCRRVDGRVPGLRKGHRAGVAPRERKDPGCNGQQQDGNGEQTSHVAER